MRKACVGPTPLTGRPHFLPLRGGAGYGWQMPVQSLSPCDGSHVSVVSSTHRALCPVQLPKASPPQHTTWPWGTSQGEA
jgi:hypothetical protein